MDGKWMSVAWRLCSLGFLLCIAMGPPNAFAAEAEPPVPWETKTHDGVARHGVPAIFVQRRGRLPERRQLKELEDYYDDLEDFYKDRDPQLADYYEQVENYYEDVRKGRRAYLPPEVFPAQPGDPFAGAPPGPRPMLARRGDYQARLERAYRDLCRQLARLNTGNTWLRYFELPLDARGGSTPLEMLQSVEAKEQLAEALGRFEHVASDPQYRVIAQLPAFHPTRDALGSFNRWLDRQPTRAELAEAIEGEEIPSPTPIEQNAPIEGPLLTPVPQ
ncbi:MAG: hypothetical protein WD851_05085 [Pirellulales bacterium]